MQLSAGDPALPPLLHGLPTLLSSPDGRGPDPNRIIVSPVNFFKVHYQPVQMSYILHIDLKIELF